MKQTIDVVFWDMGGVFTSSPFAAVGAHSASLGMEPDELTELVFGPYHADTDHPWHRLERGELGLTDALGLIAEDFQALGQTFDAASFFGWMSGMPDEDRRQTVISTIRELSAQGVRHGMITNNIREAEAYSQDWGITDVIDVVVDSSQVGLRKPNPAIFELALSLMEVGDPATTAFIDDYEGNVIAARGIGMSGVHVVDDDIDAALAELRRLCAR